MLCSSSSRSIISGDYMLKHLEMCLLLLNFTSNSFVFWMLFILLVFLYSLSFGFTSFSLDFLVLGFDFFLLTSSFSFFCLTFSKNLQRGMSSFGIPGGTSICSTSSIIKTSSPLMVLGLGFESILRQILIFVLISSSCTSIKWLQTKTLCQLSPLALKCASRRILINLWW